jgi:DNA-binding MarR family transcriptional regulator
MISLNLIQAVLQGLSTKYLDDLPEPWETMFRRLAANMAWTKGDFLKSLQATLAELGDWEQEKIVSLFRDMLVVSQLPGLSFRQRQVLVALRNLQVATVPQLCMMLAQDRTHLHRRLNALVSKGYALKFYNKKGVHFFALPEKNEELKNAVHEFVQGLIQKASQDKLIFPAEPAEVYNPFSPKYVKPATPATSATTATTATSDTSAIS